MLKHTFTPTLQLCASCGLFAARSHILGPPETHVCFDCHGHYHGEAASEDMVLEVVTKMWADIEEDEAPAPEESERESESEGEEDAIRAEGRVWEAHVDEESGDTFYFNSETSESSWIKPRKKLRQLMRLGVFSAHAAAEAEAEELAAKSPDVDLEAEKRASEEAEKRRQAEEDKKLPLDNGWELETDEDGHDFYYHGVRDESSWVRPVGQIKALIATSVVTREVCDALFSVIISLEPSLLLIYLPARRRSGIVWLLTPPPTELFAGCRRRICTRTRRYRSPRARGRQGGGGGGC